MGVVKSYDKDFKGWVSVRSALGGSLNVPAVRALVLVTPPWNFPYAIPCGNVVHALAAGSCVVLAGRYPGREPLVELFLVAAAVAIHLRRGLADQCGQ